MIFTTKNDPTPIDIAFILTLLCKYVHHHSPIVSCGLENITFATSALLQTGSDFNMDRLSKD